MPALTPKEAGDLVRKRHAEWLEHQKRWRWLQDSLEGGERYRHADYTVPVDVDTLFSQQPWYTFGASYNHGVDTLTAEPVAFSYGQIVDRNLIPHLSETGEDGRDIYALRLHRTPIPKIVERTIGSHLSRIYAREITREGPPALKTWWEDVDGCGTTMDRWMLETVAPLLLLLGQIDLVLDAPRASAEVAAEVKTVADRADLKQNRCVANIVLPENLVWWRKGQRGEYLEALVLERHDGKIHYRYWTATACDLYDAKGKLVKEHEHNLGFCPVVRVFDRKKIRCENVGQSQYESIAELQRAIYNARSELILGDVQQSHAQLQGPEKYLQKDASVPVGPSNILPQDMDTGHGWSYVEPPKGAQEAVRTHIQDFQDEADRDGALMKPAGMTQGTTVAQSGVSKIADQTDGNAMLAQRADTLARCESVAARFALAVITGKHPDKIDANAITVTYPKQFDLYTLEDLATALDDLQRTASLAGALPETETELLQRMVSVAIPGIPDDRMEELRDEIAAFVTKRAAERLLEPDPSEVEYDKDGNPIEPEVGEEAAANENDSTR